MSYVTWKVEHASFDEGTSSWGANTTITSFYDMLVRVGLGDSRDSFQFKKTNFNAEWDNYFKPNDRITISRVINSTTTDTDDILMVGVIKDTPNEESGTSQYTRVEGYNYTELVSKAIVFVDAEAKTIPAAIQDGLAQISQPPSPYSVTWNADNPTYIINPITSATSDFPIIGERFFNKPLRQILEKYSSKDQTTDGNYYYYINSANEFIWRKYTDAVNFVFDSSSDTYKSIKIGKDIKGVKNYIVIKGGRGPAGNPIQTRKVDYASINKHGQSYHMYVSDVNNAEKLVRDDIINDPEDDPDTNATGFPAGLSDTDNGFTTSWIAKQPSGTVSGVTVTNGSTVTINEGSEATNRAAYTAIIRKEVKTRIDAEAQSFIDQRKYGKLIVDIEFSAGKKAWALGNIIQVSIPDVSADVKNLRVVEIQYGTDTDTYTLSEDEGTI